MDTKKYEVFVKTAELASLTRAGAELGLTQSGVSHVLAGLEGELGFPLLTRSRTGARLTPEGERALPLIREILRGQAALDALAAELRQVAEGTVRVGTFTSVAVHWLPGMMQAFQEKYPRVDFKLFNGDYHDVDRWLTDGSVDLAFTALPLRQRCPAIALAEDRLLAILPPGHPLAAQAVCPTEELVRWPFITLLESSDHDSRRALEKAGVRPDVRFTTKDDYAIIAMVSQGMGVSIMPELLLEGRRDGIEVRPLDPPTSRTIALALPAGDRTGPAARKFADFAVAWVKARHAAG